MKFNESNCAQRSMYGTVRQTRARLDVVFDDEESQGTRAEEAFPACSQSSSVGGSRRTHADAINMKDSPIICAVIVRR